MQQASADGDLGAPAVAAYESKSGGVLDAMQGRQDEAESRGRSQEETQARHNFEIIEHSLKEGRGAESAHNVATVNEAQ